MPNAIETSSVLISWSAASGASSYDVLRTTTPILPNVTSNIAVATAVSGTTQTDSFGALSSYSISSAVPATANLYLDNTAFSTPQLRAIVTGVGGTTAFNLGSGGGGTPGGANGQVQYNNAGAFGGFTVSGDGTLNTGTGVLTVGNGAITNAKLANSATTVNGQTCTLGSTCNANAGAAAHSVALNEGAGAAIAAATIGTSGRLLIDQGAGADPTFNAMSGDATITNLGALTLNTVTVGKGGTGLTSVTANALVKGNGSSALVVSGCTIDSSNDLSCPGTGSFGSSGATTGAVLLTGKTSMNTVTLTVGDSTAAGTMTLPGATGNLNYTVGAVTSGDCAKYSGTGGALLVDGGSCTVSNLYTSGAFTGIGPTSFTPSIGTLQVFDNTATTGVTSLKIQAGAAQANTSPWLAFVNNAGTQLAQLGFNASNLTLDLRGATNSTVMTMTAAGYQLYNGNTQQNLSIDTSCFRAGNGAGGNTAPSVAICTAGNFGNAAIVEFSSTTGFSWTSGSNGGTIDTTVCRDSAGLVGFIVASGGNCNTTLANYRDQKYRHTLASGTAPTLTSGTGTIVGGDERFRVTLTAGSQTTITVTFATAYTTNIPVFKCEDETTAANNPVQAVPTLSTVVINATGTFGAADKISCLGGGMIGI